MALVTTGHLTKAPACRCTGTHASRRSTAAIFYAATVLLDRTGGLFATRVIQAAFALPFIRPCPATKGGPLIGAGR
jgi:hypothetical protein